MVSPHKFSVCPHDTAKNLLGWFTLNTYLQRTVEVTMNFEPQDSFLEERQRVLDLPHHFVYANPYSAVMFARQRGFVPLARPIGVFDETVLVKKAGAELPAAPRIASATDKLVIHNLGLTLLPRAGIDAASATFSYVGNHMNAAKAVLRGEADLGFVFNETWNGMNDSTRAEFEIVAQTRDGAAFHCFMLAPVWADKAGAFRRVLFGMPDDPAGKRILDDLRFRGFDTVSDADIDRVAALLGL
ncbi:phosphate/phosphite/phosphonate ABC transporter substrate-binding protein [Derxia gummosa]|uniref:Phosphate/phosphite/phosphonate ABC transporter substrate-binding protein n=1 Tax=Derxia gummosa DSM 723 TaxID=1121388 RepID=A0A8B6X0Q3_9BURK|nr:PhnD/SsuA/transferrin family substrate-binding protein [Derxia gummosa]